jgi:hypothetical protein
MAFCRGLTFYSQFQGLAAKSFGSAGWLAAAGAG